MTKQFNKLFRAYIFDKNFKVRNAGGYPPDYMFSGEDAIGARYDIYGESEDEVLEFINANLTDEVKSTCQVMVKFLEETPVKTINE